MSERPTAATGTFPYPHRTVAEVDAETEAQIAQPPWNVWVLAYWPYMNRGRGQLGKFKGWFPTRRKAGWGWQAQFGSFRTYVAAAPTLWKPLPAGHAFAHRLARKAA